MTTGPGSSDVIAKCVGAAGGPAICLPSGPMVMTCTGGGEDERVCGGGADLSVASVPSDGKSVICACAVPALAIIAKAPTPIEPKSPTSER